MTKEKIKKNKPRTFVIALIVVALLIIGAYFTIVAIDRHKEINASRDVEKKIALYLDKDQMEIFENIYNAKMPEGKYTYESSLANGAPTKEIKFVSEDNREIQVIKEGMFVIADKKYRYVASEEYKTFCKDKLDDENDNLDNRFINKYLLEYGTFFYCPSDGDDTIIEELDIEKKGNNYIVKNKMRNYTFDKNYLLIQDIVQSEGTNRVDNLVDYDKDFDKYYNEYFNKLKNYDEVDSYDELEKVFHKKNSK